ncbi:haloalkane dehalogenase [Qipengyuania psychrotolerans]|uniref:Haloalkane dehalogenase n=1 Tax=Qipengyuania psychrotolerans TaxID=2867238 RepID=A0ABX8ZGV7_9SPHN|nr:haloalkane dehalogenase [Qipengyuania psychrotolerans]QZD88223.1 haloalkane dehalogenase [Qipengyuania psychrotolerans]
MKILRTPSEQFENLPGFDFAENWFEVDLGNGQTARQHYVDEGSPEAPPVLLFHGEPSWSFLYRKMIPILVDAGLRVLAPDLIGFGKSDKPDDPEFFTYARHVDWLKQWRSAVEPRPAALFCQDWGGLLGLRMVAHDPEQFVCVVASNTFLPAGGTPSKAFLAWREYARTTDDFRIGPLLQRSTVTELTEAEVAAYDAPFPKEAFKAAARAFPALVPVEDGMPGVEDNKAAWPSLAAYDKPFLTLFGEDDPITRGSEKFLIDRIAGAEGLSHRTLPGCGHFCQEDRPQELAKGIIEMARKAGHLG